ncbi:hypothetical protein CNE_1c28400 [Cupriavidus necator N-1]|uniref:Uncharacterized protein n=1 Tax=Cupriavidus necator (strain ATCC 43291 / DSM 13513 / CCUG 52238 / LMG 8453 / N-1) TaxID=1042878 RepID=G0ETV4_CUPNN|nr:hypothetical protein [Cupriavidus necator]AEI78153.1 hypothetical protein CNE_1c28400 [Cupriavidus necator N-1]MDX6013321.1 hypothetical protein [Cupriavidus necator]
MSADIAIFEPVFAEGAQLVEPAFLPLRFENARPEWREFQLLIDLYRNGAHRRHRHMGLFSPKFCLKAGISGERFLRFVRENDSVDVVFINPFPQIAYWSYNVWMQGEYAHPGLADAAQALLDASGVAMDVRHAPRNNFRTLAYCNFWVGSQAFWDQYVGGVLEPIARFLEGQPNHTAARGVMQETAHTDRASYLPFIIERLLSTYLAVHPELRTCAYAFDQEQVESYCVNSFERLLLQRMRDDIDAADRNGSFTSELKKRMDLACSLWQQHFFDYFATRPHPHTGRVVESFGTIADGSR